MDSNREVDENEERELEKLQNMAKIASIYHSNKDKFSRNRNLSHIVHASLHFCQSIICLAVQVFHHVHHRSNRMQREDDASVPFIPEQNNPVFYVYPICIVVSITFAILWLFTNILMERPEICFVGCFTMAISLLSAGITAMKHADTYLDLSKIKDEELLLHPIFIHNFVMCLLSIFGMIMYLIQGWILVDYWLQVVKEKRSGDDYNDDEGTNYNEDCEDDDGLEHRRLPKIISKREDKEKEEPGELDPIPALDKFPSLTSLSQAESLSDEPVILYCCFLDCCNYIKHHYFTDRPTHEFQVIHIM